MKFYNILFNPTGGTIWLLFRPTVGVFLRS